jgi:hypothetical protein
MPGNVGIGTSSPNAKLDINGSVSLAGDIRNGWGDYAVNVAQYSTNYTTTPTYYMGLSTDTTNRILYISNKNNDGSATDPNGGIIFRTGATPSNRMIVTYGGNVGIGTTSPNAKLDVNGNAIITGSLTVTGSIAVTGKLSVTDTLDSTDVFGLTTFTKSLTLTTSWIDTGISGSALATGTYIIQVYVDNYDVSGGQYTEYYSGTMSWFASTTNSTDYDEIVLHKAGHAPNSNWINLRTLRQVNPGTLKLQIISSVATTSADNYIFKFRRMI